MTPEEAKSIAREVYGRGGQRRLAKDVGRGEVTVSRWLTGVTPIRGSEAVLLRLIRLLHRLKIDWRGALGGNGDKGDLL